MTGAEIAGTIVAALTPVGGAIGFVWNKVEKRIAALELKVSDCEAREDAGQARRGTLLTVIELLWQEVERASPASPILRRAKRLLDGLKVLNDEDGADRPAD